MYLLDTNHCSRIIGGHSAVIDHLSRLGDVEVATCVIVQGELVFMAERSEQKSANLALIREFLDALRVYAMDSEVAHVYGQLKAGVVHRFGPREKSKRRRVKIEQLGVSENDLWIAAIGIRYALTIVSSDSDFERIREVQDFPLENWMLSAIDQ